MRNFVWLLLLLFSSISFVQSQSCGAHISEEDHQFLQFKTTQMRSYASFTPKGIKDFPVKVHVVQPSFGESAISESEIKEAVQNLNKYYVNANIRFVILNGLNYIKSDQHYNFNKANEDQLCIKHDVDNVINLYIFHSIVDQGFPLCGFAYFPNRKSETQNKDRVLMRAECMTNGSSLVHEFGHFFSLYHTHGSPFVGTPKELVTRDPSRRNCEEAGDGLCDTPADPNLNNKVNNQCEYMGGAFDPSGVPYKPNPKNIMAYSNNYCRDELSTEQYNRVNYAALNFRKYLKFPYNYEPELADNTTITNPQSKPDFENSSPPQTQEKPFSKLSGEVILEISGQPIATELDGNFYKGLRPYYSGTNYNLSIINHEQAYVYVFASDLTKANYLLFPLDGGSAFIASEREKVALPGDGMMYTLDDTKGKDYLCVLYSHKPLKINQILNQIKGHQGTFTQRLYKALNSDLVPSNKVKYSRNGKLRFFGNTAENDIVPIIVQFEHL